MSDVDFMRAVISPTAQYPDEPLKTEISRTPIPISADLALLLSARVAQFSTRHNYASLFIAAAIDVKVVQTRMRHASGKTTLNVYGHMPDSDDSTRAAISSMIAAPA